MEMGAIMKVRIEFLEHHAVLVEMTATGRELRTAFADMWVSDGGGELVPNPDYEMDLARLVAWACSPTLWREPREYELRIDNTGLTDEEIVKCVLARARLREEAEGGGRCDNRPPAELAIVGWTDGHGRVECPECHDDWGVKVMRPIYFGEEWGMEGSMDCGECGLKLGEVTTEPYRVCSKSCATRSARGFCSRERTGEP